ncbi:deoxyribonuclease-2-alpha isoform X2 [Gouania willdenowi]|nr:deoxyribonuclease-2-alpha isoform X2 [Gouania willdenowi]
MIMLIYLLFISVPLGGSTSSISCYNDQGQAVDWFYSYKLPKHGVSESHTDGLMYLLMDGGSDGWSKGTTTVNDTTGALGRTVGQLYSSGKNAELAYILYNDQPPKGGSVDDANRRGHTKGVLLLGGSQGFWLVHSVPKFPPVRRAARYVYPSSGTNNGQSFICVTFPLHRFQTIGEQLQINQPSVYDCDVPQSLASVAPALAELCKKTPPMFPQHVIKAVSNRSVALTSKGGTEFISFAKGPMFDNDLYHSWVAPYLRSDLLVQFWVNSRGILPSDCSLDWKVLDVRLIHPGQTFTFKTTQDHSKWAVSPAPAEGGGGWVCVGDINRNQGEKKRGGGTMCRRDPVVWKAYRTAALECESCGGGGVTCPSQSQSGSSVGLWKQTGRG